jgi:hypothetical protein
VKTEDFGAPAMGLSADKPASDRCPSSEASTPCAADQIPLHPDGHATHAHAEQQPQPSCLASPSRSSHLINLLRDKQMNEKPRKGRSLTGGGSWSYKPCWCDAIFYVRIHRASSRLCVYLTLPTSNSTGGTTTLAACKLRTPRQGKAPPRPTPFNYN